MFPTLSSTNPRTRICLVSVLALLSTRCATSPNPKPPSLAVPEEAGLQVVQNSTDLDGNRIGTGPNTSRATVLIFFASWCAPCRHELAMLGTLSQEFPNARIIGLNAYEEWQDLSDREHLRSFLLAHAAWLPVVHAGETLLAAFGGVQKVPTLLVYNRLGTLTASFRRSKRSPPTYAELRNAIHEAIHSP